MNRGSRNRLTPPCLRLAGRCCYDPVEVPEPEPEGVAGEPLGGVPWPGPGWEPEPEPMLGQFFVELDPALVDPDVPDPVDGGGVVEAELDEVPLELVPLLPVPEPDVVELVVAALATSAPPPTSPAVRAPMASALRRRIFICLVCPFSHVTPTPSGGHDTACAPDL